MKWRTRTATSAASVTIRNFGHIFCFAAKNKKTLPVIVRREQF